MPSALDDQAILGNGSHGNRLTRRRAECQRNKRSKLTVSLVDNASQGIAALRNQMQGLSSGQSAEAFETFRRNQREMGNKIKAITEAGSAVKRRC